MRICFVGFGEVGRIYAQAIHDAGEPVGCICEARLGEVGQAAISRIGARTEVAIGSWLAEYDIVFSAVTGSVALGVAKSCLQYMRPSTTLIDMTTAAPGRMQEAARLARQAGVRFVDVGILGAVSIRKGATALVAAGDGIEALAPIAAKIGAPLKMLPGEAGDAVRLKLLRSVFTKGLEALAVETLLAAEQQGLRQEFFDIVGDIDETPLRQLLEVLVRSHVVHASRRHHEVQEAGAQLRDIGIDPVVTRGVESLFRRTSSSAGVGGSGELPAIEEALDWLYGVSRMPPVQCAVEATA